MDVGGRDGSASTLVHHYGSLHDDAGERWANYAGRLPEPSLDGVDPAEIEVHGEPAA